MPNYCENDLYVSGAEADVEEFLEFVGMNKPRPEFDFNCVLPYPEEFAKRDDDRPDFNDPEYKAKMLVFREKYGSNEDGFNSGGYEWCIKNWGTKWDAKDVVRRDYYGNVCITFQTAWSPPLPVIKALAAKFPNLTLSLEYFESGVEVCGGVCYPAREDEESPREWRDMYYGNRGG